MYGGWVKVKAVSENCYIFWFFFNVDSQAFFLAEGQPPPPPDGGVGWTGPQGPRKILKPFVWDWVYFLGLGGSKILTREKGLIYENFLIYYGLEKIGFYFAITQPSDMLTFLYTSNQGLNKAFHNGQKLKNIDSFR
jgi:hypothetical protein